MLKDEFHWPGSTSGAARTPLAFHITEMHGNVTRTWGTPVNAERPDCKCRKLHCPTAQVCRRPLRRPLTIIRNQANMAALPLHFPSDPRDGTSSSMPRLKPRSKASPRVSSAMLACMSETARAFPCAVNQSSASSCRLIARLSVRHLPTAETQLGRCPPPHLGDSSSEPAQTRLPPVSETVHLLACRSLSATHRSHQRPPASVQQVANA